MSTIRHIGLCIGLLGLLPLIGCGSALYDAQAAFKVGNIPQAEKTIASYAHKNRSSEHRVIAHLELGSILFQAKDYGGSVRAFRFAEDQMEAIDNEKEYKFTEELESAIKNPAEVTYRGTPYDRVMSSTMLGLGYCMLGDFDAARPTFRNAQFRQDEAISKRQEMIDDAQEEAENNANLGSGTEAAGESYTDAFFVGYEAVSNSFADGVQAAFLLGQQLSSSDADDAGFLFGRIASINPDNTYAPQDAAIASEGSVPDRTYVFFGTGFAPYMIDIPIVLPIPGGIVSAAFPILTTDDFGSVETLRVDAGGNTYAAEPIANMDQIVGADFNAELPLIITRHTASILAKNSVSIGATVAANEVGGYEGLLIQLVAWTYQIWQNKADIRSWQTLPKSFMYASFPTPPDGTITLISSPVDAQTIQVEPTGVNIVLARGLRRGMPVTISAFQVGTETINAPAAETGSPSESEPAPDDTTPPAEPADVN